MTTYLNAAGVVDSLQGKKLKEDVNYSAGLPQAHCGPSNKWTAGSCMHFMPPAGCGKVRGVIKPEMWCKLWEARDTDG